MPIIGLFASKLNYVDLPDNRKMAAKQAAEVRWRERDVVRKECVELTPTSTPLVATSQKLISENLIAVFSKSYCPCE